MLLQGGLELRGAVFEPFGMLLSPIPVEQRGMVAPLPHQSLNSGHVSPWQPRGGQVNC
jgi:hypothetical protein